MQRNIKILVKEPEKEPYEKIIKNCYSQKQNIIGGKFGYTYLDGNNDIAILYITNEQNKNIDPDSSINLKDINGTFIIVGDNDTGEDRSLTDEQIEKYKSYLELSRYKTNKNIW